MVQTYRIIFAITLAIVFPLTARATEKLVFSTITDSVYTVVSKRVLEEAYRELEIQFTVKPYPGQRALKIADSGHTDGDLYRITGIETEFPNLLVVPVVINWFDAMVLAKNHDFTVNGWESLKPYTVGCQRGIKFAEEGTLGLNRFFVNDNLKLYELLDKGRFDIAVVSRLNSLRRLGQIDIKGLRLLEPPIKRYELYHYLHRRNRHLIPELTNVLKAMEDAGRIDEIRLQYVKEAYGIESK